MPQAVESNTTSRRNFLAGTAVAAAILAPNVALANVNLDAELIRLGQEHDRLVQKLAVLTERLAPLYDEHRRRLDEWKRATAKPRDIMPVYNQFWDEVGLTEACHGDNDPDAITDEMDGVSRSIMRIPAQTLTGLAVKARFAQFAASHFYEESEANTDWDKLAMRKLCDAVIDMAARTAAQIASS